MDNTVEGHGRLEADEPGYFGNIRHAALHIFKSLFIGLVIRNVSYLGTAAGDLDYPSSQFFYGYLLLAAHIEHLSGCRRLLA